MKLGIGLSARFGTGLVVARVGAAGGWSAPSAIGTVGLSMGPQAGAQLGEFLIVLNSDAAVSAFAGGGALSLGPQVGAVAGPVGGTREVTGAVGGERVAGDGPALAPPYFTYSIAKGLYVGASFEASAVNVQLRYVDQAGGGGASEVDEGSVRHDRGDFGRIYVADAWWPWRCAKEHASQQN